MNLWQIGCFYELPPKISYDSPSVLGFCLVGANCTGCKLNRSRPFGGLDYEATASGSAFRDVFSDSFIPRTDSCIFSLSINQGYPQQAEYTTVNITQTTNRTTTTTWERAEQISVPSEIAVWRGKMFAPITKDKCWLRTTRYGGRSKQNCDVELRINQSFFAVR